MMTEADIKRELDALRVLTPWESPVPEKARASAQLVSHVLTWVLGTDTDTMAPYYVIAGCCCQWDAETRAKMDANPNLKPETFCRIGEGMCLCPSSHCAQCKAQAPDVKAVSA